MGSVQTGPSGGACPYHWRARENYFRERIQDVSQNQAAYGKIFLPFFRKLCLSSRILIRSEGRPRIATDVGSGTRWTCWCRKASGANADGEIVWSRSPDAGIKRAGDLQATEANKPGTPRRSRISRKPLRRECRLFRLPCGCLRAQVHFSLHARLAGAACIRHSLRPLAFRGRRNDASPGHVVPRECGCMSTSSA